MKITERDLEALGELQSFDEQSKKYAMPGWARPMDVGGRDGSHHSATLSKLARYGLVEARQRGALVGWRGSKEYRITPAGVSVIDQHRNTKKIEVHQHGR